MEMYVMCLMNLSYDFWLNLDLFNTSEFFRYTPSTYKKILVNSSISADWNSSKMVAHSRILLSKCSQFRREGEFIDIHLKVGDTLFTTHHNTLSFTTTSFQFWNFWSVICMLIRFPDSISERVRWFSLRIGQLVSLLLYQESKFLSML